MLKLHDLCQPIPNTNPEVALLLWHRLIVQSALSNQCNTRSSKQATCSMCGLCTLGLVKVLRTYLCEFCRLSIDRSMNSHVFNRDK